MTDLEQRALDTLKEAIEEFDINFDRYDPSPNDADNLAEAVRSILRDLEAEKAKDDDGPSPSNG